MSTEKQRIIKRLIEKYGEKYKTPLSKDLGVNISTVRRMFNEDKPLSSVNKRAILCVLDHDSK